MRRLPALLLACLLAAPVRAEELPVFAGGLTQSLAEARVTVSGISAGGYFAQQLHLAFPERFSGVAVLAAGPWGCAEGSVLTAMGRCMGAPGAPVPVAALLERARSMAAAGDLGELAALGDDPVWLFHGARDEVVARAVASATREFYGALVAPDRLRWIDHVPAAHHFPNDGAGHACEASASPFVGDCGFPAARRLLAYLHPGRMPVEDTAGAGELERLAVPGAAAAGLRAAAPVHVPARCRAPGAQCDLHVALHGCAQSSAQVGLGFVEQSGYRQAADILGIVVLFPQVAPGAGNPYACWDWWGYTGSAYLGREAPQARVVLDLLAALRR